MDSFLKALTVRHRLLNDEIEKEQARPRPSQERLLALKIRRLQLRDQIECVQKDLAETRRVSAPRRQGSPLPRFSPA
ncbi:MAG: YdcH family protein [Beijerinckiaceae bacterium]|nr:YdcH family protein [Beijerinckiaceae bacterium]MDO9440085.1 YdcH family protein [Beijerinckiaceae bacterium]